MLNPRDHSHAFIMSTTQGESGWQKQKKEAGNKQEEREEKKKKKEKKGRIMEVKKVAEE